MQRVWRALLTGLLSLLSYKTQDQQPGDGTIHNGLDLSLCVCLKQCSTARSYRGIFSTEAPSSQMTSVKLTYNKPAHKFSLLPVERLQSFSSPSRDSCQIQFLGVQCFNSLVGKEKGTKVSSISQFLTGEAFIRGDLLTHTCCRNCLVCFSVQQHPRQSKLPSSLHHNV